MNNNNINNDINKFDGKYLKCIVSKYNAVTDYLSNSGAMIVLQPLGDKSKYNGKEYNRNYVYLGNEFLASGYGFLCKDMRDDAENIVKVYNKTIQRLDKADNDEVLARKQADENIVDEFKNYVAKNGGPIENTTVTINNVKIPTKDIILYGEEAKYDDLQIVEYSIKINGNSTYYDNNTLLCPIGSTINNISISITTKDNDSGGIERLKVLHNALLYSDIENELNEDIEAVIIDYNCDYDYNIEDEVSPKYNLHKWYYSNTLTSDLLINEEKEEIIKGLYLYVKETPRSAYKFYPRLYEKNPEWKIISAGNIIKSHKIELSNLLNVKPQYYIKWIDKWGESPDFNNLINAGVNNINDQHVAALNNFKDYELTEITINPSNTNNNESQYELYIAIPSNFRLEKAYIIENNLNKYNITGFFEKSIDYTFPCPGSKIIDEEYNFKAYCISYDIYHFKSPNGIKSNTKFCINVINNYKKGVLNNNNVQECTNQLNISSSPNDSWEYINDEEFNNLYWATKDVLTNSNLFENGINK